MFVMFVALVMVFHLLLIRAHEPTLEEWFRLPVEGPEKFNDKIFLLFTPEKNDVVYFPLKDLPYLLSHENFNKSRPTVFYFHGYLENGHSDISVIAIRNAYMDRNDHNVVTIDWSYYSKNYFYFLNVIPQMMLIAEEFTARFVDFIDKGYSIDNVHMVGHSLGGQMVGKIGRELQEISRGKLVIPRIYVLDPAGPKFEKHEPFAMESVLRSDAKYVQVIHTNGGHYGMLHSVGTVDFYPNGGSTQHGCGVDVAAEVSIEFQHACDHARSWNLYQATVRNETAFPAIYCLGWDEFKDDACSKDDLTYMGFGAPLNATGKYFLQTRSNLLNLSKGIYGTIYTKPVFKRLLVPGGEFDKDRFTVPKKVREMLVF